MQAIPRHGAARVVADAVGPQVAVGVVKRLERARQANSNIPQMEAPIIRKAEKPGIGTPAIELSESNACTAEEIEELLIDVQDRGCLEHEM